MSGTDLTMTLGLVRSCPFPMAQNNVLLLTSYILVKQNKTVLFYLIGDDAMKKSQLPYHWDVPCVPWSWALSYINRQEHSIAGRKLQGLVHASFFSIMREAASFLKTIGTEQKWSTDPLMQALVYCLKTCTDLLYTRSFAGPWSVGKRTDSILSLTQLTLNMVCVWLGLAEGEETVFTDE